MAVFRQKKISRGQTLADKLNKARLESGLSLEELSQSTKIQPKYLETLERGDYNNLPGDIYAKAWIKIYAQSLGLNSKELLADYKIEKTIGEKLYKVAAPKSSSKNFPVFDILAPKNLKRAGITLIVLALLSYLGWELNNIIAPPKVIIFEPENNFKTTASSLEIKGSTKPEVQLTINNELVLLNEDGSFNQTINLAIGLNNLQISAKKKHSKVNNIELIILRENLNN